MEPQKVLIPKSISFTVTLFSLFLSLLIFPFKASAQTIMSNDEYQLHMGSLNSFSGKIPNPGFKLKDSNGKFSSGIYSGDNYTVSVGIPSNTTSVSAFSFSISSLFIDFGPLNPGSPITRTNIIDASAGSANGYSILSYQNHQLKNESGATIPDTTCDDGDCDEKNASKWSNILTFGFGYRCDNIDGASCLPEFSNKSYFKHFANYETENPFQAIMKSSLPNSKSESEITYKINISPNQAAGNYANTINYIAVPSL